jgi:hypothetical protein
MPPSAAGSADAADAAAQAHAPRLHAAAQSADPANQTTGQRYHQPQASECPRPAVQWDNAQHRACTAGYRQRLLASTTHANMAILIDRCGWGMIAQIVPTLDIPARPYSGHVGTLDDQPVAKQSGRTWRASGQSADGQHQEWRIRPQ